MKSSEIIKQATAEFNEERQFYVFSNASSELDENDKAGKQDLYKEASKHFGEIEDTTEIIDFVRWGITNNLEVDIDTAVGMVKAHIKENDVPKSYFLMELAGLYTVESYTEKTKYAGDKAKRDQLIAMAIDVASVLDDFQKIILAIGNPYRGIYLGDKDRANEVLELSKAKLEKKDVTKLKNNCTKEGCL